ncbi:unnamed protein product [Meganyctiphanes norvegica]|uniref:Uncharacterized protein n=1 Tax=Meganyctiphanes norvegica TaxID=48144 RepID=A0AAV2QDM4_MEGNR
MVGMTDAVYNLYLCKICRYSYKIKNEQSKVILDMRKRKPHSHARIHIQKLGNEIKPNTSLPNNYDFFECTECDAKFKKRTDIQGHLEHHSSKHITNTIVGIKYIFNSNVTTTVKRVRQLYCCEVCNFAFSKCQYPAMFTHLKEHTWNEIRATDWDKYKIYSNESFEIITLDDHNIPVSKIQNAESTPKKRRTAMDLARIIEIEIDNTDKYIPNGWERKVFQHIKGNQKGKYFVKFISLTGKSFTYKAAVSKYIEKLKSDGITESIEIEKMEFGSNGLNVSKGRQRGKKRR